MYSPPSSCSPSPYCFRAASTKPCAICKARQQYTAIRREAHHDRSVRPCSSRHGRHPCLFRHSLRAGQLTVKGIARVQPVSFRPPCYNPLLRVQHSPCHPDQLTPGVIMNMQSLFTLLPFIVLAIGITRVYCTIKEI